RGVRVFKRPLMSEANAEVIYPSGFETVRRAAGGRSNDGGRLTLGGGLCLGSSERRCTGRARVFVSEPGGRHARVPLEGVGEVALVVEARGRGDLRQSPLRVAQLPHALVQAQLARVLADRAAVVTPEHPGQVGRVHPDDLAELSEADLLVEV